MCRSEQARTVILSEAKDQREAVAARACAQADLNRDSASSNRSPHDHASSTESLRVDFSAALGMTHELSGRGFAAILRANNITLLAVAVLLLLSISSFLSPLSCLAVCTKSGSITSSSTAIVGSNDISGSAGQGNIEGRHYFLIQNTGTTNPMNVAIGSSNNATSSDLYLRQRHHLFILRLVIRR
jgi:hypothetical protein